MYVHISDSSHSSTYLLNRELAIWQNEADINVTKSKIAINVCDDLTNRFQERENYNWQ